ncbi:MAG: DUF2188 domain-containing protein [Candidatus Aenigmarchaeota archaeon]|nr:DUF2188 domain-containing protein [Candidatus Aenigmarchaeota archaeon]
MPKRKTHHVVKNTSGTWSVKKGGSTRASGKFTTQKEAIDFGRKVSQSQGTEFIIHGKDGRIRKADSHGRDPMPPKDRK